MDNGMTNFLSTIHSPLRSVYERTIKGNFIEIVQKPDAAILDVAVESAAALALGARLVQENAGGSFQLFFLAPESGHKAGLSPDPAFAEVFRPFGISDLQRLIAPWIRLH